MDVTAVTGGVGSPGAGPERRAGTKGARAMNGHEGRPGVRPEAASRSQRRQEGGAAPPSERWVCPCQDPPVLLATWDRAGRVNVKVRDRYWHFTGFGMVKAVCPRCATEHVLDLPREHDGML